MNTWFCFDSLLLYSFFQLMLDVLDCSPSTQQLFISTETSTKNILVFCFFFNSFTQKFFIKISVAWCGSRAHLNKSYGLLLRVFPIGSVMWVLVPIACLVREWEHCQTYCTEFTETKKKTQSQSGFVYTKQNDCLANSSHVYLLQ